MRREQLFFSFSTLVCQSSWEEKSLCGRKKGKQKKKSEEKYQLRQYQKDGKVEAHELLFIVYFILYIIFGGSVGVIVAL